ncbi:hypothetical protein [Streptomyces sp. NPDC048659]|uniref:hypothetical protein n=1 Tax=Streptomyces sp. NPDC048659 TaxID=3155489 RepID=UPI00344AA602
MGWRRERFESHEGEVGVLLADGSEPGPVYFDIGSGTYVHESTDWWVYTGELRRPTATSMRGRCACGWRAARAFPIDWQRVDPADLTAYDVSGPLQDWEAHMDEVAARAVRLPEDVAGLLKRLYERLDELVDDEPLTVLRAVDRLEAIVGVYGPMAARLVTGIGEAGGGMVRVAEALGMTEEAAGSRLRHYRYLDF